MTAFLLLFMLLPSLVFAQGLTCKQHRTETRTSSLAELQKKVAIKDIPVFEPHTGKKTVYRGFSTPELLDHLCGKTWQKSDDLLFRAADGYQSIVATAKIKSHASFLTFARTDGKEFQIRNQSQNHEQVDLGPYYLIWDNLSHPELLEEGAKSWPYQVMSIESVQFAKDYPHVMPPKSSSPEAKNGFALFREHCLTCHSINGQGGEKSVELNYPVNVTQYYREDFLKKWIGNPQSIRYNTTMPALHPKLKNRKQAINDLIAYLKVMAENKHAPQNH